MDNLKTGVHLLSEANDLFAGGFSFNKLAEAKDLYAGATSFSGVLNIWERSKGRG